MNSIAYAPVVVSYTDPPAQLLGYRPLSAVPGQRGVHGNVGEFDLGDVEYLQFINQSIMSFSYLLKLF